jgi:hypothetical protein
MRSIRTHLGHLLPVVAAIAVLGLTACGPSGPAPTPTMSVDEIYTAAAQTLTSQQATIIALTPPTPLPTATALPTVAAPPTLSSSASGGPTTAAVGGASQSCDSSAYVADVTIPDNTVVDSGKKFTKTWSLLNNGTCSWDSTYKLAFLSGEAMGGSSVPVPSTVPSGQEVNISVNLTAPAADGTYTGQWQLQNAAGQFFGNVITVVIKVGTTAKATHTPSPSETPTP